MKGKLDLQLMTDVFESAVLDSVFNYQLTNNLDLKIDESDNDSVQPMNKVLGYLEDTFFMPNGVSRNRRFYPESLWEKCLASDKVKIALENGTMLGMLEHPLVNQFESNGIPSTAHPMYSGIVTKQLEIRTDAKGQKYGYGKAYVLDTKIGRFLDSVFRATDETGNILIRPAISSRAFSRSVGKDKNGNDIVDENNYYLTSFDVTFSPGIPQAMPRYNPVAKQLSEVKESMNDTISDIINKDIKPVAESKVDENLIRQDIIAKLGLQSL
ncbi:hypothetical protein C3H57_04065 [Campylobacter jejuni]|uniref:Uncharacterized protein n=1 Tax=Campylobacter jejuni TaxID=197 RepID=A0A431EE79_CAMJU|nr:hypothetical protein C3H57_04065 [Campylobacter jejuni]